MKLGYRLSYLILTFVALQGNSALLAQDVAAAARANRANAASPKLGSEAQEPVDALKTCVADNTSGKDRKDLAKWIFFAMAAHPEMKPYAEANLSAAADESSQKVAALVTRLLTASCRSEVRAVVKTGQGTQAVKVAFEGLGQLAMQELTADKAVQGAMGQFAHYVDESRLNQLLAGK